MDFNTVSYQHQQQYNVQQQNLSNNQLIPNIDISSYISTTLPPPSSYDSQIIYPNSNNEIVKDISYNYLPSVILCSYCKIDISNIDSGNLKCRLCHIATYCSREHQTLDWENHKKNCKNINKKDKIKNSSCNLNDIIRTNEDDTFLSSVNIPSVKINEIGGYHQQIPYKDNSRNYAYKTTLQEHMKNLSKTGKFYNQTQVMYSRLSLISQYILDNLRTYGYAIVEDFLGNSHLSNISNEINTLYRQGLFSAGQLMDKKEETNSTEIRSDQIFWFDSSNKMSINAVHIRLLVQMVDSVINKLKDKIQPHTIGGRSPAMIAIYPGNGTKYVKHVDNPTNDVSKDGRCITAIYYCNKDWDINRDGGALRLYPYTSQTPIDIIPKADRLIFFWSDSRNPHEVMPVYNRPRIGITIWYFDKKQQVLNKKNNCNDFTNRKRKSPEVFNNSELSNKRVYDI
uniref:hypoxia-inducible factor-proline dioxygenase n=1 Tax=Strongyloides stercoralis TaxID=6248 RepID=A0AAF5CVT1_STRER